MVTPSSSQSPAQQQTDLALIGIWHASGGKRGVVSAEQVRAALYPNGDQTVLGPVDLEAAFATLRQRGYAETDEAVGSNEDIALTLGGMEAGQALDEERQNLAVRRAELRTALLYWLYTQQEELGVNGPRAHTFLRSAGAHYLGQPYTEEELAHATRRLRDEDLIKGTAAQGGLVLRPTVTTAGIRIVENQRRPGDDMNTPQGQTHYNNVNVYGAGNAFAFQSTDVRQQTQVEAGPWAENLQAAVETVRAIRSFGGFTGPAYTAEAADLLTEADQEAEILAAEPTRARRFLERLGRLVEQAGRSGLTTAANLAIQQAFGQLPAA